MQRSDNIPQLWAEFVQDRDNQILRNRLVEHYLPVVKIHAHRLTSTLSDLVNVNDLISAGVFGLMDAIRVYNPAMSVRFTSFCVLRVRGAMLDELRQVDWAPRSVRNKATSLRRARKAIESRTGHPPTHEQLADELGLSSDQLDKMIADARSPQVKSLHRLLEKNENNVSVEKIDTLEDSRAPCPADRTDRTEFLRDITRGMKRKERLVVILYYYEALTMREIGDTLGVTEARISQLHIGIIKQLRANFASGRISR